MATSTNVERWYEALDFLESSVNEDVSRDAILMSAAGLTAREIGEALAVSTTTAEHHVKEARRRLRAAAARRFVVPLPLFSLGAFERLLSPPPEMLSHAATMRTCCSLALVSRWLPVRQTRCGSRMSLRVVLLSATRWSAA